MNGKIRVLCVFSTLDRGGAESMCMNIYRHINRERIQFDFIKHTSDKCAFDEEIESLGGKIFVAPRFRGFNLLQYRRWWKDHLASHPEHRIIHGHYFTASKYFFSVCKKMGRLTIGHSHTDTYYSFLKLMMIHGLEKHCDFCFACSESAGKLLYPHKAFVVLKNAIDIDAYKFNLDERERIRAEFHLEDNLVLGVVGTIKSVKNPFGVVSILEKIVESNKATKVLWAGADGGMKDAVVDRLKELGLIDHVIFTGVRSDVSRLLQGMDVFIMPSISEGIPVALVEAQAAGLPCFVSDTVSSEADVTGLCQYIPLDMWDQWSANILEAIKKNRTRCNSMINSDYDVRKTAEWIERFYLSICK